MISDPELLLSFAEQFFGYGNLQAPIWFVGMEEGGGNSAGEINARLKAWNDRGRKCIEDLPGFCNATGLPELCRWFEARSRIQSTWNRLILMAGVLQGSPPASLEVRKVNQRTSFAREQGRECLLELFPLPSPGKRAWHYDRWCNLSEVMTRKIYHRHFGVPRSRAILEFILQYQPQFVVFHGPDHLKYFETINWKEKVIQGRRLGRATLGKSQMASICAGAAMVADEYYIEAAQDLYRS